MECSPLTILFMPFIYFHTNLSYVRSCYPLVTQTIKNLSAIQETRVQSLGREDPLEKGMAYPLQYSCLENSIGRGLWWAIVHVVIKSQTRLSN